MLNPRSAAACAAGLGVVFLGALAAEETYGDEGAKALISLRLDATNYNAGRIGTAVVYPVGDKTGVSLTISGVPDYTSRPIHLYSYLFEGSCGSRSGGHALTDKVLASSVGRPGAIAAFRGPVQIAHNIDLPFERLKATPFGISVRLGPADGNHEIYCGST